MSKKTHVKQLIVALTEKEAFQLKLKAFKSNQSMSSLIRYWILTVPVDVHPMVALEDQLEDNQIT